MYGIGRAGATTNFRKDDFTGHCVFTASYWEVDGGDSYMHSAGKVEVSERNVRNGEPIQNSETMEAVDTLINRLLSMGFVFDPTPPNRPWYYHRFHHE
jgi:hypothetical protein